MLDRLDLNLLVAFEALEETRSVSRAAERLGLRQPAMSAALARLREALGDPLFVRAAGAMQPTPKAMRIAPGIGAALMQLRASLADAIPFAPSEARRTFTVAGTDYTTFVIGPGLVSSMAREAPGIDLRIIGYDKDDVPDLIDRGEIDVALGVFRSPSDRAVRQYLAKERFVGVARRGHPALQDGRMSLEAFVSCDHALVSVRRDARGELDSILAKRGLARRIALVLPHMLVLPRILAGCELIAAVPERVARLFEQDGLQAFDLPLPVPEWRIEMLWNAGARNDPAATWLRSRVVAAVGSH